MTSSFTETMTLMEKLKRKGKKLEKKTMGFRAGEGGSGNTTLVVLLANFGNGAGSQMRRAQDEIKTWRSNLGNVYIVAK